jgi:hypothetical protein
MKLLLLIVSFAFSAHFADVKDTMKKSGETFTALQKAILVDKDLGTNTMDTAKALTDLFTTAKDSTPNLDNINDPKKREELLVMYKEIMTETVNLSAEMEQIIAEKNFDRAKTQLSKLKEKRKQGHDIFKPQGDSRYVY